MTSEQLKSKEDTKGHSVITSDSHGYDSCQKTSKCKPFLPPTDRKNGFVMAWSSRGVFTATSKTSTGGKCFFFLRRREQRAILKSDGRITERASSRSADLNPHTVTRPHERFQNSIKWSRLCCTRSGRTRVRDGCVDPWRQAQGSVCRLWTTAPSSVLIKNEYNSHHIY